MFGVDFCGGVDIGCMEIDALDELKGHYEAHDDFIQQFKLTNTHSTLSFSFAPRLKIPDQNNEAPHGSTHLSTSEEPNCVTIRIYIELKLNIEILT